MEKEKLNSQEIHEKDQDRIIDQPKYSDSDRAYRTRIIEVLNDAKNQQGDTYKEFNDMNYFDYYESNKEAGMSYNPPKKKKNETRIVTGTTEEKEGIILSTIMNMNLNPDIEAFDENDLPVQAGADSMEAMVKKSRILEDYDKYKRPEFYRELFRQGTAYSEEIFIKPIEIKKKLKSTKFWTEQDFNEIEWTQIVSEGVGKCEVNLIEGTKVLLGNMKVRNIHDQPFIAIVDYIPYNQAKSLYGNMTRWDNVPMKVREMVTENDGNDDYTTWRLYDDNNGDMVERIRYQCEDDNEFQLFLNGVMMLPGGFPLSAISGDGKYTISKGDASIIPNFAIAKGVPAKTKVTQAVLDEFLRLIILKTQQSYKPPFAYGGTKVLDSRIFDPGTITSKVDPNMLKPLIDSRGVNAGEINSYQLLKSVLDEMSVSGQFQGLDQGDKTATQTLADQRQNLVKIGEYVIGVINWERAMTHRRIVNILTNWKEPIDCKINSKTGKIEKVFRKISAVADFDGKRGIRSVEFTDKTIPAEGPELEEYSRGIFKEEQTMEEELGVPVKKNYVNGDDICALIKKWYVTITPQEEESSDLRKIMYINSIKEAIAIFGPEAINYEAQKEKYARMNQEQKEDLFVENVQGMPVPGQDTNPTGMEEAVTPTINTLAGQQ